MLRQKKCLYNLTEHALRKNQPLIILNLMHEKAALLAAEDLSGSPKMEQTCLQALSMRAFPHGPPVEISIENMQDEDQEACLSGGKGSTTPMSIVNAIPESELPTIVSCVSFLLGRAVIISDIFWHCSGFYYDGLQSFAHG